MKFPNYDGFKNPWHEIEIMLTMSLARRQHAFESKVNTSKYACIQCQSKEKRPRYSRFIKPDPNAEDSEHTSIAQEVQEENEGRSKVHGSNPTDDYRPYWIVK